MSYIELLVAISKPFIYCNAIYLLQCQPMGPPQNNALSLQDIDENPRLEATQKAGHPLISPDV